MFDTTNEIPTDLDLTSAIEGAVEPSERPAFGIDSIERADWLLRKLAAIDTEKALIKAQAEAMIAQLDADRKGLERFIPQLREWGAAELERRGRGRRTLPLFHGTLAYRKVPAGLRVADEAAARGLIKLDAAGYRAAAMEARKETGELLPGMEIVPESEHFGIRFAKDSGEGECFGE